MIFEILGVKHMYGCIDIRYLRFDRDREKL